MAKLELEVGTDVLLLETSDALLLEAPVVTPTTLALTLTTFTPDINVSDHQIVIPSTLALILTTYAPVLKLTVTPSTLALVLTLYAPRLWLRFNKLRLHPYAYSPEREEVEL